MLKTSLLVALSVFLQIFDPNILPLLLHVLYSSCFYILMLYVFYTCFHYCISVSMARCNLRPPIVLKCFISRPVVIRDLTYNSYDP